VVLPWGARVSGAPLRVMFLDWETDENTVKSRYRRLVPGYGLASILDLHYREMHQPLVDSIEVLQPNRDRLGIDVFMFDSYQ
jgi:hypothetical protein